MADGPTHHPEQDIGKGKFILDGAEFSATAAFPLPEGYGDNRLVVMARDPFWFFAYWEITHERAEQIRIAHGRDSWDRAVMVLRVHDLGESSQTPIDSASHFDVDLPKFSRQQYVQVPISGHVYITDLGLRWPDGKFVSLFRSNVIRQPMGRISEQVDTQWMSVGVSGVEAQAQQAAAWDSMAKVALGAGTSKGGSSEGANAMSLRWEFLRSVFSGSVSSWRPQEPEK